MPSLLDAPATAARLRALHAQARLTDAQLDAALARAATSPPRPAWTSFVDVLLAAVGVSLLVAGLLMFGAFNWQDLHRFARMGLAGAWVAASAGLAVGWGLDRVIGRLGLLAGAVGVGGLLAVIGQTYQTGADDWTLFAWWAALVLPWAFFARTPELWVLTLGVTNLAIALWGIQVRPADYASICLLLAALDGAAWAAWSPAARQWPAMAVAWAPRVLAAATIAALTVPATVLALDVDPGVGWGGLLAGVALGVLTVGLARQLYRDGAADRFPVTLAMAASLFVFDVALGRTMVDMHQPLINILGLSLLVLLQVVGFVFWMRSVPVGGEDPHARPA